MTHGSLHLGIDLGTTNSTAAVFDGAEVTVVRNAAGSPLTPSAVRLDARGKATVGERARRFLEADPENTAVEFKRLMGTEREIVFPASGARKKPAELATEVLASLRADVAEQLGVLPETAVVAVPALFEVPQSAATAEAARRAGFSKVELLQEPVASALAAGWKAEGAAGRWLVYDLGGGTFDASLLETRDGFLTVVGHDGDNFLGGRDVDLAIVDWALARLSEREGEPFSRSDPRHAMGVRKLKRAAEEAKAELSRAAEAVIALPGAFNARGRSVDVELVLDRATLEGLMGRLLDRSLAVCARLLERHGARPDDLERVVLVGGPTAAPALRARVAAALGGRVATGLDPMTLVAQGAALFAASSGLDARPPGAAARPEGWPLWLQFPSVSSDFTPHVVGKVGTGGSGAAPARLRLVREDGLFASPEAEVDAEGAFLLTVELVPRRASTFRVEARARGGEPVPVEPSRLTVVQGLTVSDPPLSRTIGVALANDRVAPCFERGTPLPARRTLVQETVEGVAAGSPGCVLKVPVVQGEFDAAHLCRLVGTLEISGAELPRTLPAGSPVEVTLEVDRGGRLTARAFLPTLGSVFASVAHLATPEASPETLAAGLVELEGRLDAVREQAFARGARKLLLGLAGAEAELAEVRRDVAAARGGDADAEQKARRGLLELDAALGAAETELAWPQLTEEALASFARASGWVSRFGTEVERKHLAEAGESLERARSSGRPGDVQRAVRLVDDLGHAAFLRHPEAWSWMLDAAAGRAAEASDLPQANRLVAEGRAARQRNDREKLRGAVEALWRLLPDDPEERRRGYESGIR